MAPMEGYDPVPVPVLDATIANTDIMARITLTFPQGLSLTRLEESWYALVRAWPILAARIRPTPFTPSGLSYFVPNPTTLASLESRSRSPLTATVKNKHIVLVDASHRPVGSYQPIVGQAVEGSLRREEVSVGVAPDRKEQDAMTCVNAVMTWKELLKADQSFVTAQATRWADATTVTISFSHVLGDAFAIKSIFKAWQESLNGQVPAPLEELGKDPYIEYLPPKGQQSGDKGLPLGWMQYGLIKKVRLISHLLWDIKVRKPESTLEQFYIYMPEEKVQALLAQARADLEKLSSDEKRDTTVSTFNVLFAWLLQNIHATNPKPKRRSAVLTIINAKHRPPTGHSPSDYPKHQLWGGAFGVPLRPLASSEWATLPLGQVALHIRESLKAQIEPANIQRNIVTLLKHTLWKKPSGKLIFFAEPNDYFCGATEWRSVKFGELDFGAAATCGEKEKVKGGEVKPVAIGTHVEIPMTQRGRWVIFGDAGGGVWFTGGLTRKEVGNKDGFGRYLFVK